MSLTTRVAKGLPQGLPQGACYIIRGFYGMLRALLGFTRVVTAFTGFYAGDPKGKLRPGVTLKATMSLKKARKRLTVRAVTGVMTSFIARITLQVYGIRAFVL